MVTKEVRSTIVSFLDDNGKMTERWATTLINSNNCLIEVDEGVMFKTICEREGLDLSKKFLMTVRCCRPYQTYYFYNSGKGARKKKIANRRQNHY